ncbi:RAD55 family ATPase [Pyrofollis japonicus]|uniref:RAD55 family ATPase n=1 Tax=Pyrofollis japonicus TaxID=3060460 RepID=UPI00295ACA32|nr:ATPase domain-containing protein [Pyrofollis japonicus]
MNQRGSASTGIQSLDEILCGGVPQGSFVILAGHPGSGKTTLAATSSRQVCGRARKQYM